MDVLYGSCGPLIWNLHVCWEWSSLHVGPLALLHEVWASRHEVLALVLRGRGCMGVLLPVHHCLPLVVEVLSLVVLLDLGVVATLVLLEVVVPTVEVVVMVVVAVEGSLLVVRAAVPKASYGSRIRPHAAGNVHTVPSAL